MVEPSRTSERSLTRRTVLKSLGSAGAAGAALAGTASADRSGGNGFNRITFRAADGGALNFQLVVTGRVRTDGGLVGGVVVQSDVQVANNVAQGTVAAGTRRRFEFTGDVSVLQVTGPGVVSLNGEVVRDTTPGTGGKAKQEKAGKKEKQVKEADEKDGTGAKEADGDGKRLPKEVVVSSPGVEKQLDYVFEVTGDLEKLEPDEDSGNARDEVVRTGDRVRVEGTVAYGDDRFAFSGEFVSVEQPPEVKFDVRKR